MSIVSSSRRALKIHSGFVSSVSKPACASASSVLCASCLRTRMSMSSVRRGRPSRDDARPPTTTYGTSASWIASIASAKALRPTSASGINSAMATPSTAGRPFGSRLSTHLPRDPAPVLDGEQGPDVQPVQAPLVEQHVQEEAQELVARPEGHEAVADEHQHDP